MYRIQTNDGLSTRLDLQDEAQAREWLTRIKEPDFQEKISTIGVLQACSGKWRCPGCNRSKRLVCAQCQYGERKAICHKTIQFVLARPVGFDRMFYHIEHLAEDSDEGMHGGERITCFVDDVRLTVTVHASQPSTRISLLKTGKQRYNPLA